MLYHESISMSEPANGAVTFASFGETRRKTSSVLSFPSTFAIAFLLILGLTGLVNIPTFGFDYPDDAFYVEAAHLWTRGLPPYIATFDVKAPGFFAILAFAESLLGPTLATLKIVGIVASAVAATLLYCIVEKYDRPAAIVCAILYPILTAILGDEPNQVINAVLIFAFSIGFWERSDRIKWAYCGLAIGVACMIKQTCAIDALALIFIIATWEPNATERFRSLAAFVASAAITPLLVLGYYVFQGGAAALIHDVVVTALHRDDALSIGTMTDSLLELFFPIVLLVIVFSAALIDRKKIEDKFPIRIAMIWFAFELASIVVQRAAYLTYVMPLIAPTLLISAIYVSEYYAQQRPGRRWVSMAVFGMLVVGGAMLGHGDAMLLRMTGVDKDVLEQARVLVNAAHPQSDDRLFVVNGPVWMNLVTHLDPPTPYFHREHTMCDFAGAGLPALVGNFEAKPRFIVFENPDRRLSCEPGAYANAITSALAANYRLIATAKSARSTFQIFESTAIRASSPRS